LRKAVAAAFVPLCLVASAGMFAVMADARRVHNGVLRLFEELREVALSRALLDDLRGFEQWVAAVPEATAATHPLVFADLHHHHRAAQTTFARFARVDDPSAAEHGNDERVVQTRIQRTLDELGRRLEAPSSVQDLREPLALALHTAEALARTIDDEAREIGNDLDQRSSRMTEMLLGLGVASVATVGWLGFLLLRRVLVPVRELRKSAVALGHGQLDVDVPIRRRDELGDLAETFVAMARQIRQGREELEQRVEARSREVLRSARLAELGSLAAAIAHEINNPLASIATCAEGLLRESANGRIDVDHLRDYLQIIRKEATRTCDITARLLRFSRHDTGRRERVWLGIELREVAPMFNHQFADAGVALDMDAPDGGPVVLGDPSEWRQVLFNLLRNALDASPRGGRVQVATRVLGATALLEVADQGPGIAPEHMERLFEPFFTTKGPGKGTGLGLAIVHRIVTGHGGTIAAENDPAGGARFRITMPRAPQTPGER
jgi:signal transduction histidine kinase